MTWCVILTGIGTALQEILRFFAQLFTFFRALPPRSLECSVKPRDDKSATSTQSALLRTCILKHASRLTGHHQHSYQFDVMAYMRHRIRCHGIHASSNS